MTFLEVDHSVKPSPQVLGLVNIPSAAGSVEPRFGDQFRCLSICCLSVMDAQVLSSSIVLQKCAHLELDCYSAGHHFSTTGVGQNPPPKDFFQDFLREFDQKNMFAAIKILFPRCTFLGKKNIKGSPDRWMLHMDTPKVRATGVGYERNIHLTHSNAKTQQSPKNCAPVRGGEAS